MHSRTSNPWWKNCRWTLGLTAAMTLANAGLFSFAPAPFAQLVAFLQFDRQAIIAGQVWRLVTGNVVHWSAEHFLLDVGAFLIVGLLYERHLAGRYPWILLASALAVGSGLMLWTPEMGTYRGLSGVDSGQFAAALCVECWLAAREPRRWAWVAPAALLFALKIVYECGSGQMFFGTESLGDIGLPVPLAHAAGTLGAMVHSVIIRGMRLNEALEHGFEPAEVLAGGGVDDQGSANAGALDLSDAEPHALQPPSGLGSAQADVKAFALDFFHTGSLTAATGQVEARTCNAGTARP